MSQKELYEKVQLLKAGQIVQIAGDWFQAVKVSKYSMCDPCELCDLDSICRGDVEKVCNDMDWPFFDKWYLKLAHP